jgi:hypothetical protein
MRPQAQFLCRQLFSGFSIAQYGQNRCIIRGEDTHEEEDRRQWARSMGLLQYCRMKLVSQTPKKRFLHSAPSWHASGEATTKDRAQEQKLNRNS